MKLNGKRVSPARLAAELTQAGVAHRGIGQIGDDLHTYNAAGEMVDLPAGAGPVVAAHVADDLTRPAYGTDAESLELATVRQVVTSHRAFLANATPTNAEVVAQVRRLTRVQLALLRAMLGDGG